MAYPEPAPPSDALDRAAIVDLVVQIERGDRDGARDALRHLFVADPTALEWIDQARNSNRTKGA